MFDIKNHVREIKNSSADEFKEKSAVPCVLCASRDYKVMNTCVIAAQDAVIEEKALRLCRCQGCGLVFVHPRPKGLEDLYTQDYFNQGYMKFYGEAEEDALQSNEPFTFRLELIQKYKTGGSLLDVGCASGGFLNLAREKGWRTVGLDISDFALSIARSRYHLEVKKGVLEAAEFPERSFDVIVCGDVLEHAPDPLAFLSEARRILKDDGILYVAVPDFSGLYFPLMSLIAKFNHKNYFVLPHHLYHFTAVTLDKLLRQAGFRVIERRASESKLQDKGLKRLFMEALFFLARILQSKDRIIVIAKKS